MSHSRRPEIRPLDERFATTMRIHELPSDDNDEEFEDIDTDDESGSDPHRLPLWLLPESLHLFPVDLMTGTTEARKNIVADCLPLLLGEDGADVERNRYGMPRLRKDAHASFLTQALGRLPSGYVLMDASRPWVFYWCLNGLATLGEDVSVYRERLIETVQPLQNRTGGFGGGHGQMSHVACTYACTLALAVTGGLDVIDRDAMWHFLGAMKQADGGFSLAQDAEEDIRGAYCAMTVVALLNLPLDLPPDAPARKAGLKSFVEGLGNWVGRCQTYEGGIAASPGNEAHGGYAFCALACLCLIDAPHITIPAFLNTRSLLAWLTSVQTNPEGGFAGRTNKLVDACYSQWVGGCWSLLQAALSPGDRSESIGDLWNREALIRYSLCCAQQPGKRGGLRDKPSARADSYHTNYALAGLSAAQHRYTYNGRTAATETPGIHLPAAFHWSASRASIQEREAWAFDEEDAVGFVHPVFVIPMASVEATKASVSAKHA